MKKKNEIKDELEKLSPFLSEIKKENAFKVPKNYFNSLSEEVLKQVQVTSNSTEQTTTASTSWLDRLIENIAVLFQPRYAVGFATALILVVAAFYFTQQPGGQLNEPYQLASQYVEEHIDDFDAELLWEASVFEDDLDNTEKANDDLKDDYYFNEIIDELDDTELEELL